MAEEKKVKIEKIIFPEAKLYDHAVVCAQESKSISSDGTKVILNDGKVLEGLFRVKIVAEVGELLRYEISGYIGNMPDA